MASEDAAAEAEERGTLLAALEALDQQLVTEAERDLFVAGSRVTKFCEYVLRDEKTNEPIVLDPMHRLWFSFIWSCWKRGLTPLILAPYGSGKSSLVAVALVLYLLGRDQSLRVKLVSASDELAQERATLIRTYIESSAAYRDVFPLVKPSNRLWQTKRFNLDRNTSAKDATVHAMGSTSSTGAGARSDLIVFDDVNDLRNTLIYPKLRPTVVKTVQFLLSRLEPNTGRAVGIMTRYHADDVAGVIMRDPTMCQQYGFLIQSVSDDFKFLDSEIVLGSGGRPVQNQSQADPLAEILAAYEENWLDPIATAAGVTAACRGDIPWAAEAAVHQHKRMPLWETRLSEPVLRARYDELGDREFNRGYRQRAIADSELLWKEAYLKRCTDANHKAVTAVLVGDRWDKLPRYVGVDLAIGSAESEAAYFAIFIFALDIDGTRYPLWLYRERGLSFGQQIEALKDVNVRFRPTIIKVENVGYQDAILQHLGDTTDLPVSGYKTGALEKRDIQIGLPSLAVEWEHGRWRVPAGDAQSQRMFRPLLDECASYPGGHYSDTLMAMLFARSCVLEQAMPSPRVFVVRV